MPRAGLTSQRVVDAACTLADEKGLANLTLAELAQRLGVRQPSLYKHIDGMPGLQRAISIQSKNELADALAWATMGKSRSDAILALATAYRAWALQHPGRYAATVPAPAPEDLPDNAASGRVMAVIVEVLSGFGLQDEELVHAHRALRAGMHGFVTRESGGAFGMPVDSTASYEYLIDLYVHWLEDRSGP